MNEQTTNAVTTATPPATFREYLESLAKRKALVGVDLIGGYKCNGVFALNGDWATVGNRAFLVARLDVIAEGQPTARRYSVPGDEPQDPFEGDGDGYVGERE